MYALIDNAKLMEEMTRLSAKGEMGWSDTYNQQNKKYDYWEKWLALDGE